MRRCCLFLCLSTALWADEASRLYQKARQAERDGRPVEAFVLFAKAAGLRPTEPKYRMGIERLRSRAVQVLAAATPLPEPPGTIITVADDADEPDPPSPAEIRQAEQPNEPPRLRPNDQRRSFNLQDNSRALYQAVTSAYGLQVVFDPDYNPGPPVRFRLPDVSFREALRALMAITSTFVVPLTDRTLLVAADTQQKRTEFETSMAALLPIPYVMSIEEANEVGRAVQQTLDIKRLSVDANRRQVYVRDSVTRVRLASALYKELARRRAEVMIEVELVSASRTDIVNLGSTLPTSFLISSFSTFGHNKPSGSGNVISVGGGQTLLGVGIGDASFQADWTRAHGQFLSRFQVRATDGLPATLHIGDRYPIVNNLFSPMAMTDEIRGLQQSGQFRTPIPSFTFEDLGLVLKVTPRVHDSQEVSLTLEAEFRVLAGSSINGLPIISSRKFSSAVRLREGQSSLVSGLAILQNVKSRSGFAPFSQIPLLGHLLNHNTWQTEQSELILSITPHLTIAAPGDQHPSRAYHYGTESRPVSPL
jgi:general secretion pathway protein D